MKASIVLRKWLAAGETGRVIESLQDIANRSGDKYFLTDATYQSARFNGIENLYDYAAFLENINRYDKALLWLQKVPTSTTEAWHIGNAYGLMGQIYEETGDFTRAPLAYTQFNTIASSSSSPPMISTRAIRLFPIQN